MKLAKAISLMMAIVLAIVFINSPVTYSAHSWDENEFIDPGGDDNKGGGSTTSGDTTSFDDDDSIVPEETTPGACFVPGSTAWFLDNIQFLLTMQLSIWFVEVPTNLQQAKAGDLEKRASGDAK
ncbi:MAG: hypothetical protein JW763_01545 [candidate division Zixibacteria bacterium]|nr:hypothetical protein [candidate division Zixibacteria bacterium]